MKRIKYFVIAVMLMSIISPKVYAECTDEELWRKETKYKYYSTETASRATKVFDSLAEAIKYKTDKGKGIVKTVKGEVKRCVLCPVASICKQRKLYFDD